MREVDRHLVARVGVTLAIEGARVVCQQAEALPQEPVDLFTVRRFVPVRARCVDGVGLCRIVGMLCRVCKTQDARTWRY